MDRNQIDNLKRDCGLFLSSAGINPKTKTGATLITAWWAGVVASTQQRGLQPPPIVSICLMSGRQDELVVMP
jgi:hypothetical protein